MLPGHALGIYDCHFVLLGSEMTNRVELIYTCKYPAPKFCTTEATHCFLESYLTWDSMEGSSICGVRAGGLGGLSLYAQPQNNSSPVTLPLST